MITIRPEKTRDIDRIREIDRAAFEGGPEAGLVDALRANCAESLSMVAEDEGLVVGHILFTSVVVEGRARTVTVFDSRVFSNGGGIARYRDEFDTVWDD